MCLAEQQERQEIDLPAAAGDPEASVGVALGVGEAAEERLRPAQPAQRFAQCREVVVGQSVE